MAWSVAGRFVPVDKSFQAGKGVGGFGFSAVEGYGLQAVH